MTNNFKDHLFSTYRIPTDLLDDFYSARGTPSSTMGFNVFIPGETHFISISANCSVDIVDNLYKIEDKIFYDFGVFEYSVSDIAWFSNMLNPKKKIYEENILVKVSKLNMSYLEFLKESIDNFTNNISNELTDYSIQKRTGNKNMKVNEVQLKNIISTFKRSEDYLKNCLDKNVNQEYISVALLNRNIDIFNDIIKGCEITFIKAKLEKELTNEGSNVKKSNKV